MVRFPFFVYGTLLPGQPNAYLWNESVLDAVPATYQNGRLYDMGHYPMLVEEDGGLVQGMVMTVTAGAYGTILRQLDRLEGFDPNGPDASVYRRRRRNVLLKDKRLVLAWVYLGYPHLVTQAKAIDSGDWPSYSRSAYQEIIDWWAQVGPRLLS